MATAIIITARMGSSRLKGKHLLKISNRPVIQFLIDRIKREFSKEIKNNQAKLIIATSDESENRIFEEIIDDVLVFYGSINNIPLRHLEAVIHYGCADIIAVDGDDVLCSVKAMRNIFIELSNGSKYISTSNLPFGMNCFGYTKKFLEESLSGYEGSVLETGWGRIFDKSALKVIEIPFYFNNKNLRFTLDYPEDFEFFKRVIEYFGESIWQVSDEEIVSAVVENRFFEINEKVSKKYWDLFNELVAREQQIVSTDFNK